MPQQAWRAITVGGVLEPSERRTFVQLITAEGLQPGTRYSATAHGIRVRFSTLPAVLPREGERPFTVCLGSCFSIGSGKGVEVGRAVGNLPEHLMPDLKILCGDQVYLDFPAFLLGVPFHARGLASNFLRKYLRNWGDTGGFQSLLAIGSSYFTSDDHEFWNNYPNPATIISNTWSSAGRKSLREAAFPLFEDFQCEQPGDVGRTRAFRVGSLSFLVVETRALREPGDERFMSPARLSEVLDWIGRLDGPGVLVVGQPLFEAPVNWFQRRFVDRSLADYTQYQELARALLRGTHSVLILTGDVHYARIASTTLLGTPGTPEITEVIASPLALVAGAPKFPPDAPSRFPPKAVSGVVQMPVKTFQEGKRKGDNFAVLQFTEVPGRVKVRIRHWYFRDPLGSQPGPEMTLSLF